MRYQFIAKNHLRWRIKSMCRCLNVRPSGYYSWRKRKPSRRSCEDAELTELISASSQRSRCTYGSPRIHDDLKDLGVHVSRKRVARLMKAAGIISCHHRKRFIQTTDSNHTYSTAANIIKQDFTAINPNTKWVTDITYVYTAEGWLYLAAIMDLYSRRIVGWAMDKQMTTELVLRALDMAIHQRKPVGPVIHHSDRGTQYASLEYKNKLFNEDFIQSMSRKGCCYDNAAMESFFHTLKVECVRRQKYQTRHQAIHDIFNYIETFYNRTRKHSALGYVSPVQFEEQVKACA